MSKTHSVSFVVRDYECDQGQGVNNAVYLNYLEHSRFEYIRKFLGWDVQNLLNNNIAFVVQRIEIDFKRSLASNDEFVVESTLSRLGQRQFKFEQKIYFSSLLDGATRKTVATAIVICTAINTKTGKSETPPMLEELLQDFPLTA